MKKEDSPPNDLNWTINFKKESKWKASYEKKECNQRLGNEVNNDITEENAFVRTTLT